MNIYKKVTSTVQCFSLGQLGEMRCIIAIIPRIKDAQNAYNMFKISTHQIFALDFARFESYFMATTKTNIKTKEI